MAELKFDITADLAKLREQMREFFRAPFKARVEGDGGGGGGDNSKTGRNIALIAGGIVGIWAILKGFQPIMDFIKIAIGLASAGIVKLWRILRDAFGGGVAGGIGATAVIGGGALGAGALLKKAIGSLFGGAGAGGGGSGGVGAGGTFGSAQILGPATAGIGAALASIFTNMFAGELKKSTGVDTPDEKAYAAGRKGISGFFEFITAPATSLVENFKAIIMQGLGLSKTNKELATSSEEQVRVVGGMIVSTEKADKAILDLATQGLRASDIWQSIMKDMTTSWSQFQLAFQRMANISAAANGWSAGYFYGMTPEMSGAVSGLLTPGGFGTATRGYDASRYSTGGYSGGAFGSGGSGGLGGIARNVSDGIMSPNGNIMQPSPNDMILAVNRQNIGGGSKVFNFYGVTPQEIIDIIKRELGGNVFNIGRM